MHTYIAIAIAILFVHVDITRRIAKCIKAVLNNIKMSGSESWGQETACTCVFRPMQPQQWVIYMDDRSKF